jgi:hypothetical protein
VSAKLQDSYLLLVIHQVTLFDGHPSFFPGLKISSFLREPPAFGHDSLLSRDRSGNNFPRASHKCSFN